MKKRFLAVIMIAALGLSACGDKGSAATGGSSGEVTTINGSVVNPTKAAYDAETSINIQQYARNESPAVLYTFENMDQSIFPDGRMTVKVNTAYNIYKTCAEQNNAQAAALFKKMSIGGFCSWLSLLHYVNNDTFEAQRVLTYDLVQMGILTQNDDGTLSGDADELKAINDGTWAAEGSKASWEFDVDIYYTPAINNSFRIATDEEVEKDNFWAFRKSREEMGDTIEEIAKNNFDEIKADLETATFGK